MARCLTLALVAGLLASWSGLLHLTAGDDPACGRIETAHDSTAHRIETASSTTATPQHCTLCHWVRDFRSLAGAGRRLAPLVVWRREPGVTVGGLEDGPFLPAVPARAPPV
jgi:predicted ATPase